MNKIARMSHKYQVILLYGIFFLTSCLVNGFAAMYLQFRGLSGFWVGIVTGGSAFLTIAVQPLITQIIESVKGLSLKRMAQILILFMAALYGVLTLFDVPMAAVKLIYMAIYTLNCCMPSLFNTMGMEYNNQGHEVDIGFARGIGSVSFATCSILMGFVFERFSPIILGYVYIVIAILVFVVLCCMEDPELGKGGGTSKEVTAKSKGSFIEVLKNPDFTFVLICFFVMNAANFATGMYKVNMMTELGGSNSSLGIANFIAAGTEVPVMLILSRLMKKMDCNKLLKISACFFLVKMVLHFSAFSLPLGLAAFVLQGPAYGIFNPISVYYVNQVVEPENRIKGQSVFYMIAIGGATGTGNMLGGWLINTFGVRGMLSTCLVMTVVAFVVFMTVTSRKTARSM